MFDLRGDGAKKMKLSQIFSTILRIRYSIDISTFMTIQFTRKMLDLVPIPP